MIFVFLLFFVAKANCEDAATICDKCHCVNSTDDARTLTVDCKNQNFDKIDIVWPVHNGTIKVTFSHNNITTLEPFPANNATLELVLSKCNIKYLNAGLFAESKNVKFLDLSYNLLSTEEIASDRFKGPFNKSSFEPIGLENLNLAHNQIHSLGKNLFEHMPNLKILNLEGNDFKVLDIPTQFALTSIKNLQVLNLADNELTELVKHAIINHTNLIELNLRKNSLDFVPESLKYIGNTLKILTLDDNPIIELSSESFIGLENLKELSLNNLTYLKYVNANTFVPTKKLKKLSLSNNMLLKYIDREAFAVNQSLEEFYLNNNVLYRIDYELLVWPKLRVFEFKENPLDCSCDLYNITQALSKDITKNEDGPYCTDPRNDRPVPVFYLKSDICTVTTKFGMRVDNIEHHFTLLRILLVVMSVILMAVAFVAIVLGYIRYRRYRRNSNYPYASQVTYNPLSTSSRI